ncbi:MAG: DUF1841 family protein [Methylophilales bacterium]|nr:DUF1841 family protein [Methylophilales bacterium]
MFNPTRDQVRQFFFDAWRKYRQNETLTALEGLALQVMLVHPEYHDILSAPERFMEQEYFPEMGETNPFLHMSLHLSLLEQLSIDQPTGIVAAYQGMVAKLGEHPAQHQVLDCLAETVWQAQREGKPPDGAAYLECLQKKDGQ